MYLTPAPLGAVCRHPSGEPRIYTISRVSDPPHRFLVSALLLQSKEGSASGFTKRLQSSFLPDPLAFLLGTVSNPGSLTPYTQIFPLNTQRFWISPWDSDAGPGTPHAHVTAQWALGRIHVFSAVITELYLGLQVPQEPEDQQQPKPALCWHAATLLPSVSIHHPIFCLGLSKWPSGSPCYLNILYPKSLLN